MRAGGILEGHAREPLEGHDEGPMPQVHWIGDAAEIRERLEAQEAVGKRQLQRDTAAKEGELCWFRRPGGDECQRADHREERRRQWECGRVGVGHCEAEKDDGEELEGERPDGLPLAMACRRGLDENRRSRHPALATTTTTTTGRLLVCAIDCDDLEARLAATILPLPLKEHRPARELPQPTRHEVKGRVEGVDGEDPAEDE